MSSITERLSGLKRHIKDRRNSKELPPLGARESQILALAFQWELEGTPWWSGHLMIDIYRETTGESIDPGSMYSSVYKLTKRQALASAWGSSGEHERTPLQDPPPIDGSRKSMYFRITEVGNGLAKPAHFATVIKPEKFR